MFRWLTFEGIVTLINVLLLPLNNHFCNTKTTISRMTFALSQSLYMKLPDAGKN